MDLDDIYLCPSCLTPGDAPGPCRVCQTEVLHCRPGDPDDPCRKPLMDDSGQVRTRAPRWWLDHQVQALMQYYKDES